MMELAVSESKVITAFERPRDLPFTCSDAALLEAVELWLCGADATEVAKILGIKHIHLKNWLTSKGWKYLEECVRDEVRKVASSQIARLVNRCLRQLDDRLDRGDPIMSLDGEILGYKPVSAKNLGAIATQLYDRMETVSDRTDDKDGLGLPEIQEALKYWLQEKRKQNAAIPGVVLQGD